MRDYSKMLDGLSSRNLPTAICTVYDPRFPDPTQRRLAALALSIINDAITREAFRRGLTLLDLRLIFNEDQDFANAIEPGPLGGMKLARAIQRFVDARAGDATVFR